MDTGHSEDTDKAHLTPVFINEKDYQCLPPQNVTDRDVISTDNAVAKCVIFYQGAGG